MEAHQEEQLFLVLLKSNSLDVAQKLSSRNVKPMLQRRKKNQIKQIKKKWKTLQ
jgi:hypothetical protein